MAKDVLVYRHIFGYDEEEGTLSPESVITVTHNLGYKDLTAKVILNGKSREDLIESVMTSPGNKKNELIITLKSPQTGLIQLFKNQSVVAEQKMSDVNVIFPSGRKPYTRTTSTNYSVIASFIFEGIDTLGVPTVIKLVSWQTKSNDSYDVRIVREDTGDVIVEATGKTNNLPSIVTLTPLANLPTD